MAAALSAGPPRPASTKSLSSNTNAASAKSQARRSTLVRKRDEKEMDEGLDSIPSSPSKRARVAFSDEVEVNIMEDWEQTPELIREEVRQALQSHSRKEDEKYDHIKDIFACHENEEDVPSTTTLRNYVVALMAHASSLGRSCSGLVRTLFNSDWIHREDEYVEIYIRLVGNIVSAHGAWLSDALKMLVEKFTDTGSSSQVSQPAPKSKSQSRIHSALRYILRLVPTASQVLSNTLSSRFPNSAESKRIHRKFVRSMLHIVDYAPELQSDILELITERAVKIDVGVQVDLEDLAEEDGEGLVDELAEGHMDLNDDINSETSDDEEDFDEEVDPEVQRAKEINNSVQKLDLIMDEMFNHYSRLFTNPSQASIAISTLLSHFSTLILPTYRSRHTQFLQFHFFQTSAALVDSFVGSCLHLSFDKSRPAVVRQSAAAYLASFVARGKHVPASITRDVFIYLGKQLQGMRTTYEPSCRGPDPRRYQTFYALSQALMYIFCFRWRDLLATTDDDRDSLSPPRLPSAIDPNDNDNFTFIPGVKDTFHGIMFSPLNPLRVCSPSIVNEFVRLTEKLELMFLFSKLESNKRVRLVYSISNYSNSDVQTRETALSVLKDDEHMRLDAYFPFDPYRLPLSKKWVEDDYREWEGLEEDGDDVESDDD